MKLASGSLCDLKPNMSAIALAFHVKSTSFTTLNEKQPEIHTVSKTKL